MSTSTAGGDAPQSREDLSATVLLVDDDTDTLDAFSTYLRSAGLTVKTAADGNQALALISRKEPDVVIADVRMPGMNGYELCRLVRALGHTDVPFIFCSGMGQLSERIEGLRMGADDYVVKPTNPEELLLKARAQVARIRRLRALKRLVHETPAVLTGLLGEVTVIDLFQILGLLALDAVAVSIESDGANRGEVYLEGDEIVSAAAGRLAGNKAFFRLLSWSGGRYRVERRKSDRETMPRQRLDRCLLEGLAALDEARQIRRDLALDGVPLTIRDGADTGPELDQENLQVLALVEAYRDMDRVLDRSPLSDVETLRIVGRLLLQGMIVARRASGPTG